MLLLISLSWEISAVVSVELLLCNKAFKTNPNYLQDALQKVKKWLRNPSQDGRNTPSCMYCLTLDLYLLNTSRSFFTNFLNAFHSSIYLNPCYINFSLLPKLDNLVNPLLLLLVNNSTSINIWYLITVVDGALNITVKKEVLLFSLHVYILR